MQAPPAAEHLFILLSQPRGKRKEESEAVQKFPSRSPDMTLWRVDFGDVRSKLLAPQYRLSGAQVIRAVVNPYDDDMFRGGRAVFGRFGCRFEVIILRFGIRKLAHRVDIVPVSGVHGVFGPLDR